MRRGKSRRRSFKKRGRKGKRLGRSYTMSRGGIRL